MTLTTLAALMVLCFGAVVLIVAIVRESISRISSDME